MKQPKLHIKRGDIVKAISGEDADGKKTGKVIERSRWFVPAPIVNLILRCVGG